MCLLSAGNWNNGSNAGVWALNANNSRTNSNNNVGFRADSFLYLMVPKGRSGENRDAPSSMMRNRPAASFW